MANACDSMTGVRQRLPSVLTASRHYLLPHCSRNIWTCTWVPQVMPSWLSAPFASTFRPCVHVENISAHGMNLSAWKQNVGLNCTPSSAKKMSQSPQTSTLWQQYFSSAYFPTGTCKNIGTILSCVLCRASGIDFQEELNSPCTVWEKNCLVVKQSPRILLVPAVFLKNSTVSVRRHPVLGLSLLHGQENAAACVLSLFIRLKVLRWLSKSSPRLRISYPMNKRHFPLGPPNKGKITPVPTPYTSKVREMKFS